jgi:ADP-heptose:LPS heptosyltransferase
LGVGGNDAKRVGGSFEPNLLHALFRRGYSVVLDHGAGAAETERTRQLVELCRHDGISTGEIRTGHCDNATLLTWNGSLNGFAGIIAASDLYAGYDSAGGHLAAALGVPGIDIFSGAVCGRMRDRWRPWGKTPAAVVPVEPSSRPGEVLAQAEKLIP